MFYKEVDLTSKKAMESYLFEHSKHNFSGTDKTYWNYVFLGELKPEEKAQIKAIYNEFNEANAPYVVIDTSYDGFQGSLVLMALIKAPEGPKLLSLDFLTNSELLDIPSMADYCKVLLRFGQMCDKLRIVADGFYNAKKANGVNPDGLEDCRRCSKIYNSHIEGIYTSSYGHYCSKCATETGITSASTP